MKTSIEMPHYTEKQEEISQKIKKLIEKQNTPKSLLSRFASTYAHSSWRIRWGLGGLSLAVGGIVGFFISPFLFPTSSIIGAVLGFLSYFFPTQILKKHHQAEFEHQQNLTEEVTKLEVMLRDSIKTIQALEKPMRALTRSLEQKNRERADSNKLFQESVESFKHQADESEQVLQELVESKDALVQQNQQLSLDLKQTKEVHQQLSHTQSDIFRVSEELKGTSNSLVKDAAIFHDLSIHVVAENKELDALHDSLKKIEADARKTQRALKTHLTSIDNHATLTTETAKEREESSEALQKKVLANLDSFLQSQGHRFFKGATQPPEIMTGSSLSLN